MTLPHTIQEMTSVNVRLATRDDIARLRHIMPMLSFSSITNYHTCPTYGVITKSLNASMHNSEGRRNTALEAGGAAHEVFAAARIHQLIMQDLPAHAWHHAKRIFGESRREQLWANLDHEDPKIARYNFAMEALYTSGYVDDPFDKKRTFANIEETMMDYLNKYNTDKYPVFVLDSDDPESFVGIEVPVILVMSFEYDNGKVTEVLIDGFLDGLHYHSDDINRVIVNENKTAARITDSWSASFIIDHQCTLYALMASLVLRREVTDIHVYGSPLPVGRQTTTLEPVVRTSQDHATELFEWVWGAVRIHLLFGNNPLAAPRYTHSCGRYFSSCAMLPLCAAKHDEREQVLDSLYSADQSHLQKLIDQYDNIMDTFINI